MIRRCAVYEGGTLVIAGDLFEDEHRAVGRSEFERLVEKALAVIGRPRELYIALSASSHDPLLREPYSGYVAGTRVYACNCPVRLGGIVVAHGDSVIRNGAVAYLVERVARGFVGRALRRRLSLGSEWLVYGHTHVPLIDPAHRLANPGPWKAYGFRRELGGVVELPNAKFACLAQDLA